MSRRIFLLLFFLLIIKDANSQGKIDLPTSVIYKETPTGSLSMVILYPPEFKITNRYPCMVFFFGGGWINGSIEQFRYQAQYFSQKGIVCFLVDYRVQSRQGTTPFESLEDAKSAIRYIRKNADVFHIFRDSLVACGGSAGGQLAAASAVIDQFDESTDDLRINAKPNALVLFNPAIDNGPAGYGYDRIGEKYKDFSPLHNIRKGAPPTIIFLGTKDRFVPIATMEYYKMEMEKVGSRCDLFLYDNVGHGFFNKPEYRDSTLSQATQFLISLGYISKGSNEK